MAAMPPFPGNPTDDFLHVLEHVILLGTNAMRNAITIGAGVMEVNDLLLVDEESLIDSCSATTTVMSKMRLKTLKRWTEKESDLDEGALDVQNFTPDICRSLQKELARTKKSKGEEATASSGSKDKVPQFSGKTEH